MNLNKVIIIGRIVREPELKTLQTGMTLATMNVATNRNWTDKQGQKQQEAEFHNVVAFGKTAEIMSQYCTKGGLVAIEGRLKTKTWKSKSGETKQQTTIVVDILQLGPKPQVQKIEKEIKIEDIQGQYEDEDINDDNNGMIDVLTPEKSAQSFDDIPF
jgi:single-strand DNA-binding protein